MVRAKLLSGTVVRSSGVYVAYAVAMCAVALTSAQVGTSLAVAVFSKVLVDQGRDTREASRVEKRLKQMALSRQRVERAVRGEVRVYSVPKMNAARLAVAMDQTEHPAIVQKLPSQIASAEDAVQAAAREPSDVKVVQAAASTDDVVNAKGTRVAAYVAVLPELRVTEDAAVEDQDEASGDASASDDNAESNKRTVVDKAKTLRKRRSTAHQVNARSASKKFSKGGAAPSSAGVGSKRDLRIADTPNDIILRQLGGTT